MKLPENPDDHELETLFGSLRSQVVLVVSDMVERVQSGIEARGGAPERAPGLGELLASFLVELNNLGASLFEDESDGDE